MKALRFIVTFAVGHFVLLFVAFSHSFGRTMDQFDRGLTPSAFDQVSDLLVDVLCSPFVQICGLLSVRGGGLAEWFLLGLNSLLWGAILYCAMKGCRRLLQLRSQSHEPAR